MSSNLPERPDALRRNRRPVPAADERVDPVDYRATPDETPAVEERPQKIAPAVRAMGSRRETALPFSTRLATDVLDLIDQARAAGEGDGKVRHVVEKAIRDTYGELYGPR
ncbi:hypothetical protein C5C03_00260 [Clavibacter michiganensis]|uniref:hypothetical protein n=1 Tax=Clavibacter michiganensis TaxID=28447 RepID=UPI000CE91EEA|nr:hypothetical protein [Clavibacter michiganensis]PPF91293.1 hypothetical protein C5C03_00260 [Clavibacter michiganensis]PPF99335.1 hypothetical protein C5C05_02065 [Clavibacter michiganensis]